MLPDVNKVEEEQYNAHVSQVPVVVGVVPVSESFFWVTWIDSENHRVWVFLLADLSEEVPDLFSCFRNQLDGNLFQVLFPLNEKVDLIHLCILVDLLPLSFCVHDKGCLEPDADLGEEPTQVSIGIDLRELAVLVVADGSLGHIFQVGLKELEELLLEIQVHHLSLTDSGSDRGVCQSVDSDLFFGLSSHDLDEG